MECAICYINSSDVTGRNTFVTLPCETTQHLNQRHTLCFHCFIMNHATSDGKCPLCRDNYMDYVRETHDVPEREYLRVLDTTVQFADNSSSPIPPPGIYEDIPEEQLIIIEQHDEMPIVNQSAFIPNNPDIGETFEEFARYVLENCDQDLQQNRCIVCGIDMGEDNPRQYCEKTYCPEE